MKDPKEIRTRESLQGEGVYVGKESRTFINDFGLSR